MSTKERLCGILLLMFTMVSGYAQINHTTIPENNATVDKLSLVYIDYDTDETADMYQSEDYNGKKLAVRNEAGDSIAGAFIVTYECPQAILKIQPSIYEKGTYTIDMPKGYLWLYDSNGIRTLSDEETLTFNVSGKAKAPEANVIFSPSPEETQKYLSVVTFTVEGYVAHNVDHATKEKITVTDAEGNTVTTGQPDFSYGTDEDPCHCIITLDKLVSTQGVYTIHIPNNIFKMGEDWNAFYQGDYEMLPATDVTYNVEGSDVTVFEVEGGGTSSVTGLKVTFPTHTSVALANDYASYTIYNTDGYWRGYTATWDNLITTEGNVLTLEFSSPMTSVDNYKLAIPEGDLVFEDGSKNTPVTINFSVTEPAETHVTASPVNGSTVNELYAVKVNFDDVTKVIAFYSDARYELFDVSGKAATDASGNNLYFLVDEVTDNTLNMRLTNGDDYTTLTTSGTYHFTIPNGYFFLNDEKTAVNSPITLTYTIEEGADTHTYVPWGYYDSDDVSSLGALGTGTDTYDVAIFIPGDGLLHNAKLAGAKIPVRDANMVTSLTAWVTSALSNNLTYINKVDVNNPHVGYNTIRFDEPFTVPAEGCYLGYTICVDNSTVMGDVYPVVIDETNKIDHSLYINIPGYNWYDYGPDYGCSALQGLFQDLDLSEASATFGTIEDAITQAGTTSDWRFPITTNSESDVNLIEYEIDVEGKSETRTAVVNIPAGYKQQSTMTVNVASPKTTGNYTVRLTVTKINGKDNATSMTSVSTFTNVTKTVTRHTLVEELTGTGCGWCPRGLIGLQKLNEAYGDSVICVAFHQYNSSDPMYCNYASIDDLYMSSAPQCAIDRKEYADPYIGNDSKQNGIVDEVANYLNTPAAADITIKAAWATADCNEINIDASLEAFTDDNFELVYVVTADQLSAESTSWKQANYYAEYTADNYPEDLALFCIDGEYGHASFHWAYDDVVIGSSYDESGKNTSTDVWAMKAGDINNGTFTVSLPQTGVIVDAIKGSIDKVYAVVFALDGKRQVAQAAKVNVVEISSDGIEEVKGEEQNEQYYDLMGRRITTPHKGQIVIFRGKKVVY